MESFLIASKDKKAREEYILLFCRKKEINTIDTSVIEEEQTIGIAIVRNLQKTLFLKPLKSKLKAVIINNAHTLTTEAQNALLKILEEPPPDTIIILSADNANPFLPTVISRCKIIQIPQSPSSLKNEENDQLLASHLGGRSSFGQRLKLAEKLAKNKDDALVWIEQTILATRSQLLASHMESGNSKLKLLTSLQKTYTILKTTNTNPRLTLENLLLNI